MEKEVKISPEAAKEVRTRIEDAIHKRNLPGFISFHDLIVQGAITKEEFATIQSIWKGEIDIIALDKIDDVAYIVTQRYNRKKNQL